jgi:hypothetical protein
MQSLQKGMQFIKMKLFETHERGAYGKAIWSRDSHWHLALKGWLHGQQAVDRSEVDPRTWVRH